MIRKNSDSATLGMIIGFILPLIFMSIIILFSSSKFDSIKATIDHFQTFGLLYKILSISLMPGAGLFLLWSNSNKLNQARGTLIVTLFYGVFVILLYMM